MKLTRRQLAAAALAPAALAQTTGSPAAPEEELKQALARLKANSEALAKFQAPIETEPAFQFKA